MKKTIYNPDTLAPPVGHFDRAVRFGNDWLFISGTSALTNVRGDMKKRKLVKGIKAQTNKTVDNIERVLKDAGGKLSDIYEMRMIIKKRDHFAVVDSILKERIPKKGFIAHGYKGELLHPDMELEIEAYAYLGKTTTVRKKYTKKKAPAKRKAPA
jgi:enamine deaminase RidA (YjgF/YER057c/UK114 family)